MLLRVILNSLSLSVCRRKSVLNYCNAFSSLVHCFFSFNFISQATSYWWYEAITAPFLGTNQYKKNIGRFKQNHFTRLKKTWIHICKSVTIFLIRINLININYDNYYCIHCWFCNYMFIQCLCILHNFNLHTTNEWWKLQYILNLDEIISAQ